MKPDRIILGRHGQSEGNVDKKLLATKPDYALELTPLGWRQGDAMGAELLRMLGHETVFWYNSTYFRTRQTFIAARRHFPTPYRKYEDPRLREQEWTGKLRNAPDYNESEVELARDQYGHFYYRLPGESCADVFDRVGDSMITLHRDFKKSNFPKNAVIICHGMTMRVYLMRWFHLPVEQFEQLANPSNCGMYVLALNKKTGKYELEGEWVLDPKTLKYEVLREPRKYKAPRHPYQFDWDKCPLGPVTLP
jgi:broad specificity phosphatase PhoE